MRVVFVLLWIAAIACNGRVLDDRVDDAATPGADAPVEPPPPPPPPVPGRELASGAGRLTGGPWTVDVQIGSVADPSSASGEGWTVRGGAPLNP